MIESDTDDGFLLQLGPCFSDSFSIKNDNEQSSNGQIMKGCVYPDWLPTCIMSAMLSYQKNKPLTKDYFKFVCVPLSLCLCVCLCACVRTCAYDQIQGPCSSGR